MNVVRRLALILALVVAALASESSAQQPGKVHRIGLLHISSAAGSATRVDAQRQGLRDLGYVNLKTAKALGLMLLQSLMVRADHVIQ